MTTTVRHLCPTNKSYIAFVGTDSFAKIIRLIAEMVRRCAWGTCNSDERYPDRMQGYKFIPFPKPKKNLDKCLRWIKACGRPHDQLNVNRINKHKAVCSKHFVGENGPTDEFPDPVQADGSVSKPSRKRTTRFSPQKQNKRKRLNFTAEEYINENISFMEVETGTSTQTDEQCLLGPLTKRAFRDFLKSLKNHYFHHRPSNTGTMFRCSIADSILDFYTEKGPCRSGTEGELLLQSSNKLDIRFYAILMATGSCLLALLTFVTILETFMFAVFLAGWSSYVYVLMENGFYSNACNLNISDLESNSSLATNFSKNSQHGLNENILNKNNNKSADHSLKTLMITAPPAKATSTSCKEQQEHLNLLYAISIGMVAVISEIWGPLIYRYGTIFPKLLSMMFFISGCLILGFSNSDIPLLIVPGMVLSGVGGLAILCINMKVASLLPFGAGFYVAVLNGAADSSVITFRILKLLHEAGIPDAYTFIGIIALHIILCGSSIVLHKLVDKPNKAVTYSESSQKEVPFSKSRVDLNSNKGVPLTENVGNNMTSADNVPTIFLKHSLCSLVTFSLMFWFSVLWLYFFLYIGTINSRLQNYNPDRVSHITNIMAYIMLGGLVTAFIPGGVAELQKKLFKGKADSLKRSLLINVVPLVTTSLLAVLLNTLSFIESEVMFYIEFAVLTIFRSFLATSNMSFILSTYPITHANVILPIGFTISGTTSTLQYAIFVWYNHSTLQVQVFMTVLLILSLIHPIVVYLTAKGVLKRTLGCYNNGTDRRDNQKPNIIITHM